LLRSDTFGLQEPFYGEPTAASTVGGLPTAPTTAELIPQVSTLRYRSDLHLSDVRQLDALLFANLVREQANLFERYAMPTLLSTLAERGLSWSSIAKIVGVSIPGLRKWRRGESASPSSRRSVAILLAAIEVLENRLMVQDPASWLEIPLATTSITLADVFSAGRLDLLLDYARRWITTPEQLLDLFHPSWRDDYRREFETFVAPDGELAIRRRSAP
jgi:transcriptional regulator with XRE-family HTH domain